ISADGTTLTFRPEKSFAPNERVTVSVGRGLRDNAGDPIAPFTFSFGTSLTKTPPAVDRAALDEMRSSAAGSPMATSAAAGIGGGDTPPAGASYFPSSFPRITVASAADPSPGVIFLSNIVFNAAIPTTQYLMTIDNAGVPTFAARAGGQSYDFKWQKNGTMTFASGNAFKFYALDSSFAVVDSFACGGGYTLDIHDLQLLPNGHALVLGLDPQVMDMSRIVQGGDSTAVVVGLVIQELDSLKNVVFQWRSFDHFQITDATHEDLTAPTIDYVHANAIQLDNDGTILLSSRHMDEVTKIDRTTGDIIWRLGGKNNQFAFINDSLGFSHQHAVRRIANGHITLFDNGNFHIPQFSRAVEYNLDENAKTATLVWQYRHVPDIYGFAMGYVQRQDNGNTLVSWGAADTAVTEVRSDGTVVFEMTLPPGVYSYRAYRFAGPSSLSTALVAPVDSSSGLSADPILRWNAVPGALAYRLQVARDSSFSNLVLDDSSVATASLRVSGLSLGVFYHWRVMPLYPSEAGRWSDP
ncbi:MAG: aryl-sulfate sulfotransferase, partial [Bacteroidota bacterium]